MKRSPCPPVPEFLKTKRHSFAEMDRLPSALLSEVLSHLCGRELAVAAQTSQQLRAAAADAARLRCLALRLPLSELPDSPWSASAALRYVELLRRRTIAAGITHTLWCIHGRLFASGSDANWKNDLSALGFASEQEAKEAIAQRPPSDPSVGADEGPDPGSDLVNLPNKIGIGYMAPVLSLAAVRIVEVATGSSHSLAVTSEGTVYSFGSNEYGQLGMGEKSAASFGPQVVAAGSLASLRARRVSCGDLYSLVIDAGGLLHGFGTNAHGETGVGYASAADDYSDSMEAVDHVDYVPGGCEPTPIRSVVTDMIADAAAGRGHTLLLLLDGRVASFGRNDYGQLGRGRIEAFSAKKSGKKGFSETPAIIDTGNDGWGTRPVVSIACGRNHSIAADDYGCVFAWGCNLGGQAAASSADSEERRLPQLLAQFPMSDSLGRPRVLMVAAAISHSLILTDVGVWSKGDGCPPCSSKVRRLVFSSDDQPWLHSPTFIAAGGHHSILAADELFPPRILSWGGASEGQCGYGVGLGLNVSSMGSIGEVGFGDLCGMQRRPRRVPVPTSGSSGS